MTQTALLIFAVMGIIALLFTAPLWVPLIIMGIAGILSR